MIGRDQNHDGDRIDNQRPERGVHQLLAAEVYDHKLRGLTALDEQEGLSALACRTDRRGEPIHRRHRLAVHADDQIARPDPGVLAGPSGSDRRDDDTFSRLDSQTAGRDSGSGSGLRRRGFVGPLEESVATGAAAGLPGLSGFGGTFAESDRQLEGLAVAPDEKLNRGAGPHRGDCIAERVVGSRSACRSSPGSRRPAAIPPAPPESPSPPGQ